MMFRTKPRHIIIIVYVELFPNFKQFCEGTDGLKMVEIEDSRRS